MPFVAQSFLAADVATGLPFPVAQPSRAADVPVSG